MLMPRCAFVSLLIAFVLAAACGRSGQDLGANADIKDTRPQRGLVVGSVTAMKSYQYYEQIRFKYRSSQHGGGQNGVLTSGVTVPGLAFYLYPGCKDDGLVAGCGRLFALDLPPGDYEIYEVSIGNSPATEFNIPPMVFTVTPGTIGYLGNLHAVYCSGVITDPGRGLILGADFSINDEIARDAELLRRRFSALKEKTLERRLLVGQWKWRRSVLGWFRTPKEPASWGTCLSGDGDIRA